MHLPKTTELLIAALSAAWLTAAPAAEIMFSDGEFSDWSSSTIAGEANGQVSSVSGAGGNPDAFFSVTTTTNLSTFTGHFDPAFVYDPALGAINFIRGSLDYRNISAFGEGHGVATVLLEQAGSFFAAGGFITGSANFEWQSVVPLDFGAGDFGLRAGGGVLDFSTAGAPIAVGFETGNQGGNTINVGYDNFLAVLDVTPVPLPAPMLLLASGLAVLSGRIRGK